MKITKNFLMVSNYNADISWILDYTDNYIIYDRSDTDEWIKPFDSLKVKKVKNIGWDIYDKFNYIINNYDNLPDVIIMIKGNIFKYITKEEFDNICNNELFTPLFTKNHKTYMPLCFYDENGMYNEKNNSWYLNDLSTKYFKSYNSFAKHFGFPTPKYIKFAPGSNYIVSKENILWYPKKFYERLRDCVGYSTLPGEAQIIERCLYYLWSSPIKLKNESLQTLKPFLFPKIKIPTKIRKIMKKIKYNLFLKIKKIVKFLLNDIRNFIDFIDLPLNLIRNIIIKKSFKEIIEYRKKIKVYDCFNFFNEIEILDIRLNILNDYVDYFVLIESKLTHSGIPKELFYEKNKNLFEKFKDKIIHIVIDNPLKDINEAKNRVNNNSTSEIDKIILKDLLESNNIPGEENIYRNNFARDFYEKEYVKKALYGLNLDNEDFCFVSDLDEIWNPKITIDYSKDCIYKIKQKSYVYYLNNRSNENWRGWTGTIGTKYKNIKNNCLNHIRTKGKTKYEYIENGGWHFSFQGGEERVKIKIASYSHQEINKSSLNIKNALKSNNDIIGRNFKFWIDEKDLPEYILKNKGKYKDFFKK